MPQQQGKMYKGAVIMYSLTNQVSANHSSCFILHLRALKCTNLQNLDTQNYKIQHYGNYQHFSHLDLSTNDLGTWLKCNMKFQNAMRKT
jgi:hypothetical protein